jgi:hypothetical protein
MAWTDLSGKNPGDPVTAEMWNQLFANFAALAAGDAGAPAIVADEPSAQHTLVASAHVDNASAAQPVDASDSVSLAGKKYRVHPGSHIERSGWSALPSASTDLRRRAESLILGAQDGSTWGVYAANLHAMVDTGSAWDLALTLRVSASNGGSLVTHTSRSVSYNSTAVLAAYTATGSIGSSGTWAEIAAIVSAGGDLSLRARASTDASADVAIASVSCHITSLGTA